MDGRVAACWPDGRVAERVRANEVPSSRMRAMEAQDFAHIAHVTVQTEGMRTASDSSGGSSPQCLASSDMSSSEHRSGGNTAPSTSHEHLQAWTHRSAHGVPALTTLNSNDWTFLRGYSFITASMCLSQGDRATMSERGANFEEAAVSYNGTHGTLATCTLEPSSPQPDSGPA